MGLYDINIGEWKIIDAGPVKCVIRAKGSNILNNKKVDFEITLTSYAAKSWIDVSYRIINTTYDELHIKSLVFYANQMRQLLQVMICLICTLIWIMTLPDVEMYLQIILKRVGRYIIQEEQGN